MFCEIELNNVSKRFGREWIFKGINYHFKQPGQYAILGFNGSGKSTLLRILSGHLTPTKGKFTASVDSKIMGELDWYRYISIAAPYIELIEEFTLKEILEFHSQFKSLLPGIQDSDFAEMIQLPKSLNKQIRHFSSGMKQRVKLGLALLCNSPVVLLDEPTTNLDQAGNEWYHSLISRYGKDRLLIIASNVEADIAFCEYRMAVNEFK